MIITNGRRKLEEAYLNQANAKSTLNLGEAYLNQANEIIENFFRINGIKDGGGIDGFVFPSRKYEQINLLNVINSLAGKGLYLMQDLESNLDALVRKDPTQAPEVAGFKEAVIDSKSKFSTLVQLVKAIHQAIHQTTLKTY